MFNFALSRDIVPANPCQQVRAPAAENQRDRALSVDEVRRLWEALDTACLEPTEVGDNDAGRLSMAKGTALALKFQLVTAQRKGEVACAAWSEIDLDTKIWTIPVEKSKNRLPHRVPLTDLALKLLEEIRSISRADQEDPDDRSPWLFPSPRAKGQQHILETAIDRAVRNNREAFGIPYWVPHDLRRTAASMMTSIGVSRLTVSKILNHVERGVTASYDRHSYDNEKRKALEAWSRKLESILTSGADHGNVIDLRIPEIG
jgi:integrase